MSFFIIDSWYEIIWYLPYFIYALLRFISLNAYFISVPIIYFDKPKKFYLALLCLGLIINTIFNYYFIRWVELLLYMVIEP